VRAPKGFTLIEVLIAIVILAALMMAVTQSLLPIFDQTRETRVQVDANQQAQQVVEAIRAAWSDLSYYRKTCAPLTLPSGVAVSVTALDKNAHPTSTLPFLTDCTLATPDPDPVPAKRVSVVVTDANGAVRTRLTMDIPEP